MTSLKNLLVNLTQKEFRNQSHLTKSDAKAEWHFWVSGQQYQ